MNIDEIDKNLHRGGEYFIYSLWIQSQMTDLIILNDHPRIIKKFVNNFNKIPRTLGKERIKYWQKDFRYIMVNGVNGEPSDLNTIYVS